MATEKSPPQTSIATFDHDITQFRERLAVLKTFLMGSATTSIEECDNSTEELIASVFGRSSANLEIYEYAELGEAGGLVNVTGEAPEGANFDENRDSLRQRQRVLESCISDLETRRAQAASGRKAKKTSGPKVIDFMSSTVRSVSQDATLKEAAQLLQEWKIGSLLVDGGDETVGSITETELTREVIANGVDANATTVKTCMREPIVSLESSDSVVDVVQLMKEKATRHVCVTENGKIVGLISVSDILRYYSGVK
ncbi:MAG: CBS domain-containing protein [Nitrospirae bacterium]|nr:CBS domain-containing protein [Nitrospirota bacterium]MDA1304686.1 CBS domain-containing protein [Nitrospirota bacterium]